MSFKTLLPQQVPDFIQKENCIILDYRDLEAYRREHLPGAMRVSDPLIQKIVSRQKRDPILVYCYHGISSQDLATLLGNFGCRDVSNLEGGWAAWAAFRDMQTVPLSPALSRWMEHQGFDPDNLNSRIENGMSPLMQAALLAERSFVDELIEAGADLNLLNDDENNALWFGCVSEDTTVIRMLIEAGINIDNRNVNGATCLIYAASAGKYAVTEALVNANADLSNTTLDGFTALDSAATLQILRFLKPRYAQA